MAVLSLNNWGCSMTDYLPTLAEFRTLRDYFQYLRREQVYPQLKALEKGLNRQIEALMQQHSRAEKRDKELLENKLRPLQWEYQTVQGQIALIESEYESLAARVPEHWRAQVFEILSKGA